MLFVILQLNFTASFCFVNSFLHRLRNLIGVHEYARVDISRCSADGLNQRSPASQESFLVRIEDSDGRDLRQIQALPKQINAHQHVKIAATQVPEYLNSFERIDFAVQIAAFETFLCNVARQVFGHPFR